MKFTRWLCSNSILILCKDIAVIIVCPSCGLTESNVIFSRQSAERVILISASASTIFEYLDNVTHTVVLVLNTLIEYSVSGKSDIRGHTGGVVTKLDSL